MTTSAIDKPNWTISLGAPFFIFLSCLLVTFSSKFKLHNELSSDGILVDLLITAPFVYFLAIRKSNVSKLTIIRVFMLGLLYAGFILRSHSSPILQIIKTWFSPIIEAFVIFIILRKFSVANKKAKAANNHKTDFLMHCKTVMFQVTGNEKFGNIISSEIAVFYYAFLSAKDKTIDYKTKFSSYKENGISIILGTILWIFLIETTGVHFLLSLWSKPIAWIFTAVSFYTCIQLFAHIRAIKARPIIINADSFEVHNGLAGDAFIQLDNIEKIEMSTRKPKERASIKISLLKGLENHNIVVYLKNPINVTKVFSISKQADTILFFVDKPKEFVNVLGTLLHKMN